MKTSWNEMQHMEDYLLATGDGGDRAVFGARLLVEPDLSESLQWQQATYAVVHSYGRQKLKEEIAHVAHQIFSARKHAPFRQQLLRLFSK